MQVHSPELVAVDIGNSSVDLAVFSAEIPPQGLPEPVWRIKLPTSELGPTTLGDLARRTAGGHWYVASVNQPAMQSILDWSQRTQPAPIPLTILGPQDFPIPLAIRQSERLGLDRRAAALAGNRIRPPHRPLIIIDVGTAITVNLIDAEGIFQGGAILPGLMLATRALAAGTDRLPQLPVPITPSPEPIGKDTEEAMQAGIFWGAVGSIHEIVTRIEQGLVCPADRIITGGAAEHLADFLRFPAQRLPNLVLAGIALAAAARIPEALRPPRD